MIDFRFLTDEQIFGNNRLDIINKYGTKCAMTDFSILLGSNAFSIVGQNYTSEGNSKKDRTGSWWINKKWIMDCKAYIFIVYQTGMGDWADITKQNIGARPAFSYSSIPSICLEEINEKNGIIEIEYGEYPQTVVSMSFSEILEDAYSNKMIGQTGKSYTTYSINKEDSFVPFQTKSYIEYEYNGKKYIRFATDANANTNANANANANADYRLEELSDGRLICDYNTYWIEVEPIKWMVDKKADIALSKKIIFSGVQFDRRVNYNGDFNDTDIKKFMDNYFSKDIKPSFLKETNFDEKKSNTNEFNFEQVSEEEIIRGAIESDIAVFLHGPSSEGKSARIRQIDPTCEIIYLRNATPESLNGKSVYNQATGEMIDVKPSWLKKLEVKCEKEPDRFHIVFLDEITNALPSIQGMAFNIVLDKEVNGIWKLPKNARIVAAGNDMKDSLSSNKLAEPLFNRFAHVYIKTTTESWLQWAIENNIHPAIYTYIAYKKGTVLRSKYDGEKPNADPRKWEMASKMLYTTGQPEMLRALVGEDITREFVQFCKQKVITLDDVINENYTQKDIQTLNTSEKYTTTLALSQVDDNNLEKVRSFVTGLGTEFRAIFDALWIRGNESRLERLADVKLAEMTKGGIRRK